MRTGAVIAAAGIGKKEFEPMKVFGIITVIERLILTLQKAGVAPIVVVTGNQAQILEKRISKMGVICLRNSNYTDMEMIDSARMGFEYLNSLCDQILFSPADMALFSHATVEILMKSGSSLAIPVFGKREGHPILIDGKILPKIINYRGEGGLRMALQCCGEKIDKILVEDEGILVEAGDMEETEKLVAIHSEQLLRPKFALSLVKEKEFFDKTTADLLWLIKRTESVRTACSQMGISYSKCWNILNLVEEQLKYPVLIRHPGGMNGGHTTLSPEGELLLHQFEIFFSEAEKAIEEIYDKIFKEN